MGQRLVVTIEKNEKAIAKIYYHWSGYTADALYKTRDITHCIYNHKDESEKEMLLRLIRFCEESGGGIDGGVDSTAGQYIREMYPNVIFKSEHISRNDGLIALNEEDMLEMQRMSEGDVYINLDEDKVDFCVYSGYESLDEYNKERKSWDEDFEDLTVKDLDYVDYDLGIFYVDEIDDLLHAFEMAEDNQNVLLFRSEVVELI